MNKVILGDAANIKFKDNNFDTVIVDPPYGLKFMGKSWDGQVPSSDIWKEVLRVSKPGAFMFAFGGTRTFHRLACAIEDAGWEIRDCMMWLYGSGFPKSHNLGNGWGTALKPAYEPIILAMKPLDGTFAANAEKWGVAGMWIDGGRIPTGDELGGGKCSADYAGCSGGWRRPFQDDGDYMASRAVIESEKVQRAQSLGRWPANLLLDEEAARALDEQAEGVSRFFYCAKASKKERNAGLDGMPEKVKPLMGEFKDNPGRTTPKSSPTPRANYHPTVKPVNLLRYLVKLSRTSEGGIVLDPFAGSGSTGVACALEGRDFIGIEINQEYVDIANKRIEHTIKENKKNV